MCGIAGMVGEPDPDLLAAMARIMAHRGPDDEGVWSDAEAGLAARRLKIIDLVGGHQPMTNEDESCWLVFNGEIYNHRELRSRLEARGHRFRSRTDGETILHLYEEDGDNCLDRLEGMFAFALWDRPRRRLLLARDPLGIKPLYYCEKGGRLAFASEAKALLLDPDCPREPDLQAIAAYLSFLYVPSPATAFSGIRKLLPAQALAFEGGRARLWIYWRPEPPESRIADPAEAERRVLAALVDSVTRHLMSDVPLGVFLSSGMDSSTLVALMRRASSGTIRTFTLDFEEESFGEARAARGVAGAFATDHREFIVRPDVAELLPELVWHLDEPLADSSLVITHLVARRAREHVTVALSGIGGDELFVGYPRYLGARLAARYGSLAPAWLRRGLARLSALLPDSDRSDDPTGRLRRFLEAGPLASPERYLAWISFWSAPALRELLPALPPGTDPFAGHRQTLLKALEEGQIGAQAVAAVAALDRATYLPDDLLMLGDKMTMAASLELRVPFCDRRLVETVLAIEPRLWSNGYRLKPLLRRVMEPHLPPEVLARPKRGFSVPLATWLRGPLSGLLEDLLSEARLRRRGLLEVEPVRRLLAEHRSGRRSHADRLFALVVLELWQEVFWDGWAARRKSVFADLEQARPAQSGKGRRA